MVVPRILSQTWKTHDLPARAQALRALWAELNPGLEIRHFDDAGARAVLADVMPDRLAVYDALPFGVMRADLFRYAVLLRDGGVYADIDMRPHRPLPDDLFARPCSLPVEAGLTATRQRELGYSRPFQIANCIMIARPGHAFLRKVLDHAFDLIAAEPGAPRARIEDLTGPRMLTRLIQRERSADVWIGSQIQLMAPLHHPDIWPLNRHVVSRHECHGTWKAQGQNPGLSRRWIERDRFVNPFAAPVWRRADQVFPPE